MIDLITDNIDAIRKACEDHDVKTLWVFGSAVNDTWVEGKSDVDFLVELGQSELDLFDQFMGLYVELESLTGHAIDLVDTHSLRKRPLIDEIERTREIVFESQDKSVLAGRSRTRILSR